MIILAKVPYGSRLYGFAGPTSDYDTKYITIPSLYDMVWGKGDKNVVSKKDDDDDEFIPLHRLMYDYHMGVAYAYEIVYFLANSERFNSKKDFKDSFEIYDSRLVDIMNWTIENLNTGNCCHMINYALGQATRYGLKGAKLKAIMALEELLDFYCDRFKNGTTPKSLASVVPVDKFCEAMEKDHSFGKVINVTDELSDGAKKLHKDLQNDTHKYMHIHGFDEANSKRFMKVFDKMYYQDITIAELQDRLSKMRKRYGGRVTESVVNGYQDRKALHHTLRIALEALIIKAHYFHETNFESDSEEDKEANPDKWQFHDELMQYVSRSVIGINEIDYGLRFPLRRPDTVDDWLISEIYNVKFAKSYFLNGEETRDKIVERVEEMIELLERSEELEPCKETMDPKELQQLIFEKLEIVITDAINEQVNYNDG